MYKSDVRIDDVYFELKKNHKVSNKGNIKKAYDYAYKMHKSQKRKSGEPYVMHLLRVAHLVASWGFESDVICAALLHDVVEDCPTTLDEITQMFDSNIASMVDTLTAIDKELQSMNGLSKSEIDRLSDQRLQEKMSERALFIKVADRIDNLNTIEPFSEEKKLAKAKHTREIIIPMLKKEGAFWLIDVLEDLCLKIEHPDRYQLIQSAYTKLIESNQYTTTRTLKLFTEVFSPTNFSKTNEFCTVLSSITDFIHNPRSSISVYRQLNAQAEHLGRDFPKLLCKSNIAMYDLTLVVDDTYCNHNEENTFSKNSPSRVFFKLYSSFLEDKNITILDFGHTTYKDSKYYILSDEMDNLYRLFVKSETEYLRYKLGHIIDTEDVTDFTSENNNHTKIKVFKKDMTALYIESGATILDFAFALHSEIGLHFDYALIDNSLTQHKAYEHLIEGDSITIVPNPAVTPSIQWFRYVKTSKAIDALVKYFSLKE